MHGTGKYLPWLVGAACVCAYLVAQYLCNHYVRRQKILSTGSPIPGCVSYVSLTGFVGTILCCIWSLTITWWAPIPLLLALFFLRPFVPSENFSAWLRLVHHFEKAEGSDSQRVCIATAMSEIEDKSVQAQRLQLSETDQPIFMMTYECAVMWCLKRGMEDLLKPEETESVIVAMRRHFAKHAWYQPEPFQRIWSQMQVIMPRAIMKTDDAGCPPYPLAEMSIAAELAGYPLHISTLTDLRFGMHVGLRFGMLIGLGRSYAADFAEQTAKTNPAHRSSRPGK